MQHILYRMKLMFRRKSLIFWSLAFPIILGFFFYLMFDDMGTKEMFSEVPIGVLDGGYPVGFLELLKETEMDEGVKMFAVTEYDSREDALNALKSGEITGFVDTEGQRLTVKESGISASVIRTFLNQYKQNTALFEKLAIEHPQRIGEVVASMMQGGGVKIGEIPLKGTDNSPYTQYFYALISMACLIGSMVGLSNGNDIQADLSAVGARRNVAPTRKVRQVFLDFIAAYIIYCMMMAIVLFFCIYVYGQDFGENTGLIFLGSCIGSFTGIAAGTMIAVLVRGPIQKKEGICFAFFMVSSFLGGLQWGNITYLLEKSCPIINRINPATLIVNGFKSLAVFGDYRQYAVNMVTLSAIGVICLTVSVIKMRRTKYASL